MPPEVKSLWDIVNSLGGLANGFIVLALIMGWFITKREADAKDKRIAELQAECAEWKSLYLRRFEVVGNAVDLAKRSS